MIFRSQLSFVNEQRGQMIRCMVNDIRVANRVTRGVHLVKLDPEDSIVHAFVISSEDEEYIEG